MSFLVHRRIRGLETQNTGHCRSYRVHRRIRGLEKNRHDKAVNLVVHRRIRGLENTDVQSTRSLISSPPNTRLRKIEGVNVEFVTFTAE